jgi:hypothetical protein
MIKIFNLNWEITFFKNIKFKKVFIIKDDEKLFKK